MFTRTRPGPCLAKALLGQALALRSLGRFAEAMDVFDTAEALGSREAVAGKGCLMLTLGDFERGLEGYEARWLKGKSLAEALGTRFETWSGPGQEASACWCSTITASATRYSSSAICR